jgi:hypothetical protein
LRVISPLDTPSFITRSVEGAAGFRTTNVLRIVSGGPLPRRNVSGPNTTKSAAVTNDVSAIASVSKPSSARRTEIFPIEAREDIGPPKAIGQPDSVVWLR